MDKRKYKKKKKSSVVFFVIFLSVILLAYFNYDDAKEFIDTKIEDIKNNNEKDPEEVVVDKYKNYRNIKNYKDENKDRYVSYKLANSSLDYETVVNYVNIGLDFDFYSYISDVDMDKGILILVNKYHKLSSSYKPNDLEYIDKLYANGSKLMRKEAKEAFEKLSQAALDDGYSVLAQSTYRSYNTQESLYNNVVKSSGKTYADSDTARPGHSEHQTGLTVDVCTSTVGMENFASTKSFTWMQNNAYKYGFILRYPKNKTNIHGYRYESWHYRYVGVEVATDMHNNYPNLTYDEYYYKFID